MSEQSEVRSHEAGDLGRTDVDEDLKKEVTDGPLDEQSGDPHKTGDSHDAVGQSAPTSETDLTP